MSEVPSPAPSASQVPVPVACALTDDNELTPADDRSLTSALNEAAGTKVSLTVRWKSHAYTLPLSLSSTLGFLKVAIALVTGVRTHRQKLVIAKAKGKLDDTVTLASLGLSDGDKVMLIGNVEENIAQDLNIDSVIDDFADIIITDNEAAYLNTDKDVRNKLTKISQSFTITYISHPRPNKKLLVLDLDYTLFDMKTEHSDFKQLKRPFTHRMLAALWPHYELVVWSQTSWRWLELKLTELGMLTHSQYQILFVLDKTSMPSVHSMDKNGVKLKHHCKPLSLIFEKLPQYNESNTAHVDDLARNFVLNPKCGIKVSAFKRALENRATDRELLALTQYLMLVKDRDFRSLDHGRWKEFVEENRGSLPSGTDIFGKQ